MWILKPNKLVKKSIVIFPVISACVFFAVRAESRRLPEDVKFKSFRVQRTNCDELEKTRNNWERKQGPKVVFDVRETICDCYVEAHWQIAKSLDAPNRSRALNRWRFWPFGTANGESRGIWPFVRFDEQSTYRENNPLLRSANADLKRLYNFDNIHIHMAIKDGVTSAERRSHQSDRDHKSELPMVLYFTDKACKLSERSTSWNPSEARGFYIARCDRLAVHINESRGLFYGYGVQASIFWGLFPAASLLVINLLSVTAHFGGRLLRRIWDWTNN